LALVLDSAEFVSLVGYDDPEMVMCTVDRADTRWHDPALRLPARDAAAAQKLVNEIIAEHGEPVRFTVETFANEGHIREANVVKQIVEAQLTGITVEVSIGTVAELMGKWRSRAFDASNHAVRWSDPALDLPASFGSASAANITGYGNAAVDAALEALAGATQESTAIAAHHAVLRQVLKDLPVIFLSHKEAFHVIDHHALRDWKLFYSLRPIIEEAWLPG
jgi:ABC-type oligopeptide transport system substrate-binding subunit